MTKYSRIIPLAALLFAALLVPIERATAADEYRWGFRQDLPNYFGAQWSDDARAEVESQPTLKFQLSFKYPFLSKTVKLPWMIDGRPVLGMTYRGWWDIAGESAPFVEHNYMPSASWDSGEWERWVNEIRVGYLHQSTGVAGGDSRGWDRVTGETSFDVGPLIVHAQGWYSFNFDSDTEGLGEIVNFGDTDLGGQVLIEIETDAGRYGVQLGKSWQKYLAMLKLRDPYNVFIFGELHNGKFESLERWDVKQLAGQVGLALFRE